MTSIQGLYAKISVEHIALGITIPISVLLPLSYGLSLTEVGMLLAATQTMRLIFDLPTGMFADRLGRKHSLVLSNLAFAAGFLLYGLATSFSVFLLAAALQGIAFALLSGADEAYLFESIERASNGVSYRRAYSFATIVDEVATIVGLGLASLLVVLGSYRLAYIIAAALMVTAALVGAVLLHEPDRHDGQRASRVPSALGRYRSFALLLIAFALLSLSGRVLWQPQLVAAGFTAAQLGLVFAGLKLFSILGAHTAGRHRGHVHGTAFAVIAALSVVAIVLMMTPLRLSSFVGFALYFFLENVFRIFQSDHLNQVVPAAYRASMLSLNSAVSGGFGAAFAVALGAVADVRLSYAFVLFIAAKMVVAPFLFSSLRKSASRETYS